ncbi:hypothetical protein CesoFtcFv8_008577 [Champsocephalus esox]|uniref:Uncharacterized protein n=1 Tax=Champsocephalus esox TaxID=159716 RepID=A0AAN8H0S7_9TELE|nr:hypothetical protein CesoFtcFv8_008577 [Champsocephalus esox]
MKNSPQQTPLRLSSVRLQHGELTRGKRRDIQRQAGRCLSPTGSAFYPLTTVEKSKLFGRHTGRLKFSACSGAVPCPTMAGVIRAVSQTLATGSAAGHPQGPINVGVPRKVPSNAPVRRCCNPASLSFALIPPLIT